MVRDVVAAPSLGQGATCSDSSSGGGLLCVVCRVSVSCVGCVARRAVCTAETRMMQLPVGCRWGWGPVLTLVGQLRRLLPSKRC